MKAGFALTLTVALLVAGCGGNDVAKNEIVAPVVPKTILTQNQFLEVKANCIKGEAELKDSTSTQIVKDEDGVPSTETVTYDGPPEQKTILLGYTLGDNDLVVLKSCLKSEFERLGAEARLQPPEVVGP
jgi:hypothetical protein